MEWKAICPLSREELVEEAYRRQGERIAYALNDDDVSLRAAFG